MIIDKVTNDPIQKKDFGTWLSIFLGTSGRFLSAPRDCGDVVRVDYTFVDWRDYQLLRNRFEQMTTNIVERDTRHLRWWRRIRGIIPTSVRLSRRLMGCIII